MVAYFFFGLEKVEKYEISSAKRTVKPLFLALC